MKTKKTKSKLKDTSKIKIGITIALKDINESIWSNGIKQNVFLFAHMLKKSKKNYEVCILNTNKIDMSKKPEYLNDLDFHYFDDKFMEMDLIVMMGAQIHDEKMKKFKDQSKDKKFIGYKCGNNYIISVENMLFKDVSKNIYEHETTFDEVWYIPQQDETNKGYFKTLYRANSFIVPFIWHNKFLFNSVIEIERGFKNGNYKKGYKYNPNKEKKMIGVMEPNLNVIKSGVIPTMIAEECYRGKIGKEKIDGLMVSNAELLKTNKEFLGMIGTFDLYKDKKISAESRYQTAFFLTQHLDVLICHQNLNPLNYLYLDAAFLGYPVLHNAHLCKDLGYYYENSDTVQGAKQLEYILTEHDKNIEAYHEKNNEVLNRYYADNENIINTYDKLIENLFNGGNPTDLKYNWKTNLYDNLK